jgi:hypothetical protein
MAATLVRADEVRALSGLSRTTLWRRLSRLEGRSVISRRPGRVSRGGRGPTLIETDLPVSRLLAEIAEETQRARRARRPPSVPHHLKGGRCWRGCGLNDSVNRSYGERQDHGCVLSDGHPGPCEFIAPCLRSRGGVL